MIAIDPGDVDLRINLAEVAFEKHKKSSFHEKSPCGGCHFWQGYIAGLQDLKSGQWHFAMRKTDKPT